MRLIDAQRRFDGLNHTIVADDLGRREHAAQDSVFLPRLRRCKSGVADVEALVAGGTLFAGEDGPSRT